MFILMAQQRVGERPGRIEPSVVKRRPLTYPLLTRPREVVQCPREHHLYFRHS